jgi:tagaturonate epimerase
VTVGVAGCSLALVDGRERLLVPPGAGPFTGVAGADGVLCELTSENARAVRETWPALAPQPLGLAASFGFGDRLGCATRGHVAALRASESGLAPILAQQSVRELRRTGRSFKDVLDAATWGVVRAGWSHGYGADADHLQELESIREAAAVGFTTFTLDPSPHVQPGTATLSSDELADRFRKLPWDRLQDTPDAAMKRLSRGFEHATGRIEPGDDGEVMAAMVKYGNAVAHTAGLARAVPPSGEIELSLDEAPEATSPLEHAIVASALRRLGVRLTALAPRFPGHLEKGIDYRGSVQELAAAVEVHAALAETLGPYKLSLHSGSDKLSVYQTFARASGGRFHVKTAGTSYLEALRLAAATDPELMREIWTQSCEAFGEARHTYEMAATLEDAPAAELSDDELPGLLDNDAARQILHVNFGGVIGSPQLRDRLTQVLAQDDGDRYAALLEHHLAAHLSLLRT